MAAKLTVGRSNVFLWEDDDVPSVMSAPAILDREYLEMRAKLIELAASLDRLDRASETVAGDPRMKLLHEAIDVLSADQSDRAERLQLLFSLPYDVDWRNRMGIS